MDRRCGAARLLMLLGLGLGVPGSQAALDRIRGVNMGGWLVLERWITPSMFTEGWDDNGYRFSSFNPNNTAADQWQFCSMLGPKECRRRLEAHWDTWVTHDDVRELHEGGITHMRVPVGFWMFGDIEGDEPYVDGDLSYFMRLCDWAREFEMQIWVDLHAAPGSQNGFDNSGHYGNATWEWKPRNIERSVKWHHDFSRHIAAENYTDVVTGVGLLNEPDPGLKIVVLTDFYEQGFKAVRRHMPSAAVFIGDMFAPADFNWFWADGYPDVKSEVDADQNGVADASPGGPPGGDPGSPPGTMHASMKTNPLAAKTAGRAYLDTHIYHVFTESLRRLPADAQILQVCKNERDWIDSCCWEDGKPTQLGRVIGEWTAAFDRRPSEEWEVTKLTAMPKARKDFIRKFVEAQMTVFEQTESTDKDGHFVTQEVTGWFFWNFKMELDHYREWDYLMGLREGWIPKLPSMSKDSRLAKELFGSCDSIHEYVSEHMSKFNDVVTPFPEASVSSDHNAKLNISDPDYYDNEPHHAGYMKWIVYIAAAVCIAGIGYGVSRLGFFGGRRGGYDPIGDGSEGAAAGPGEMRLSV